ncbi:MAG: hypothetical protein LBO08_02040 [Rickettsiales bacterium]|jgi:hypothetical protein|nr:hypothetical protein [Rickettsiales bacterium]
MKETTDELLEKIQKRLEMRGRAPICTPESADIPAAAPIVPGGVIQLTPDQIVSRVFTVSPAQIEYIAKIFGNRVADDMNMRAFAGKIRLAARRALVFALESAKKSGE